MRLISILTAILSLTLSVACNRHAADEELVVFSGLTQGTTYNIKLRLPAEIKDRPSINRGIEAILENVNRTMSTYQDDSELSVINRTMTTDFIPISESLSKLLVVALEVSEFTTGAFDVTVGQLVNLWGFGAEKSSDGIPTQSQIDLALTRTGYKKIMVAFNPPTLGKSDSNIYLDLSGIAQGYTADIIATYLDKLEINNYMIEIGGEIRARGLNADGLTWRIGIEKPVADRRQVERIIQLDNLGMSTSGDYRNYFEIDGKRYSHIIDPVTGWPVAHDLVSVTVLDPSTARADALTTALIVMGPDKGFEFAENHGISAMFIIRHADVFTEKYTGAFEACLIDR